MWTQVYLIPLISCDMHVSDRTKFPGIGFWLNIAVLKHHRTPGKGFQRRLVYWMLTLLASMWNFGRASSQKYIKWVVWTLWKSQQNNVSQHVFVKSIHPLKGPFWGIFWRDKQGWVAISPSFICLCWNVLENLPKLRDEVKLYKVVPLTFVCGCINPLVVHCEVKSSISPGYPTKYIYVCWFKLRPASSLCGFKHVLTVNIYQLHFGLYLWYLASKKSSNVLLYIILVHDPAGDEASYKIHLNFPSARTSPKSLSPQRFGPGGPSPGRSPDVSVFFFVGYPLVMTNIAMENDHLWWIFPLKIVIFHSYVKLPEGRSHLDAGESHLKLSESYSESKFLTGSMGIWMKSNLNLPVRIGISTTRWCPIVS